MMISEGGGGMREFRKGNWTIEETMVLIEAKKMDDERRLKSERGKPTEQRWKWVEDYCWRKGCYRSQSQCNDKWDNLMRDFKKVREYERIIIAHQTDGSSTNNNKRSYWRMEKNERKDKTLPPNMLSQIYDALVEVVERKGSNTSGGGGVEIRTFFLGQPPPPLLPPALQHYSTQPPTSTVSGLPISLNSPHSQEPSSLPHPQPQPSALPLSQPLQIIGHVESDTNEPTESPSKRRRREEGTSGAGGSGGDRSDDFGCAISRSATIIAEAILAREEKEERRHRELVSLHEKRLQIEESKAEMNRQGINGMVDAINKLSNSILALADNKNQVTPK